MTKKKLRRKLSKVLKRLAPGLSMSARLILSRELVKSDFYLRDVYESLEDRSKTNKAALEAFGEVTEEWQCNDYTCCGPSIEYLVAGENGFKLRALAMEVPPPTPPKTVPKPTKQSKKKVDEDHHCWVLITSGEHKYEDSWYEVDSVYPAENRIAAVQRAFDLMSDRDLHQPYEERGALHWEAKEDPGRTRRRWITHDCVDYHSQVSNTQPVSLGEVMELIKRWYDEEDEDGFAQIFEFSCPNEGTVYAFTTEKQVILRDEGGDILDEIYKNPTRDNTPMAVEAFNLLNEAVAEGLPEPEPFDEGLREMYDRCIEDY